MSECFASAERVSVWTQPARPPEPFRAWGEALRAAFETPAEAIEVPAAVAAEFEVPVAVNEDPFAEGYAAGVAAARAEAETDMTASSRLAAAIEALKPQPAPKLGAMIAATVERLLSEIVGTVEIDVEMLRTRAVAAAELIEDETRPSVLRLNPADLARMQDMALPVSAVPDAGVAPGDLRLETMGGAIEDGVSVRMEKFRATLDRVAASR